MQKSENVTFVHPPMRPARIGSVLECEILILPQDPNLDSTPCFHPYLRLFFSPSPQSLSDLDAEARTRCTWSSVVGPPVADGRGALWWGPFCCKPWVPLPFCRILTLTLAVPGPSLWCLKPCSLYQITRVSQTQVQKSGNTMYGHPTFLAS